MTTTPASLLERLRDPAKEADWDHFVRLYSPLLCCWARRLGLNGADVADLVQDVFTILVRKLPAFRYDPNKRFRAWLWTITVNKCREKRRGKAADTLQAGEGDLARLAGPDSADAVDEAEYRQYLVRRALQLMQAKFQPATWRAFWECVAADRPAAEVAAELGLSVDAVYAAKSRVLRHLRRELDGLLE